MAREGGGITIIDMKSYPTTPTTKIHNMISFSELVVLKLSLVPPWRQVSSSATNQNLLYQICRKYFYRAIQRASTLLLFI
jgi:hypothetical protein